MSQANPRWGAPRIRGELLKLGIVVSEGTVSKIIRRRVVPFNVTEHPTQEWTARQLIEAFPWDTAPRYLIRDRDGICGPRFRERVRLLGIDGVPTAPRSPWQNPFVERLIGSIRRECLDHVIVLGGLHHRYVRRAA